MLYTTLYLAHEHQNTRGQHTMTNQQQIREAFYQYAQETGLTLKRARTRCLPQNRQPCDTRMAFVDFVDSLERDGQISQALAARVTL